MYNTAVVEKTVLTADGCSFNKVREITKECLLCRHWTKALVLFDDVDISKFHNCVVVELWQSLSVWHLLLSACVLVCRCDNVGPW